MKYSLLFVFVFLVCVGNAVPQLSFVTNDNSPPVPTPELYDDVNGECIFNLHLISLDTYPCASLDVGANATSTDKFNNTDSFFIIQATRPVSTGTIYITLTNSNSETGTIFRPLNCIALPYPNMVRVPTLEKYMFSQTQPFNAYFRATNYHHKVDISLVSVNTTYWKVDVSQVNVGLYKVSISPNTYPELLIIQDGIFNVLVEVLVGYHSVSLTINIPSPVDSLINISSPQLLPSNLTKHYFTFNKLTIDKSFALDPLIVFNSSDPYYMAPVYGNTSKATYVTRFTSNGNQSVYLLYPIPLATGFTNWVHHYEFTQITPDPPTVLTPSGGINQRILGADANLGSTRLYIFEANFMNRPSSFNVNIRPSQYAITLPWIAFPSQSKGSYATVSGTYQAYHCKSSFLLSQYWPSSMATFTYQMISQSMPSHPSPFTGDTVAPFVNEIQLFQLPGTQSIVVRIKVFDDVSGFKALFNRNNPSIYLSTRDLIQGTPTDGVYETFFKVPFKADYFLAVDQSLNQRTYSWSLIDTNILNRLGFSNPKTLNSSFSFTDIIDAQWSHPIEIDLTNQSRSIDFYFKVINPSLDISPILKIVHPFYGFVFYGEFNSTSNRFEIPIILPMNMFTGVVDYQLEYFSTIGSDYLNAQFSKSTLRVYSQDADVFGPELVSLYQIPSASLIIPIGGARIGWEMVFFDRLNGFNRGNMTVIGSLDQQEYVFELNQLNFPTVISIEIMGECRSQTFRINSMVLIDNGGYISTLESSALINLLDESLLSIEVICRGLSDTIPPALTSFDFSPKSIDVGSIDRVVNFTFTLLGSDIHPSPPIIYITSTETTVSQVSVFVGSNFTHNSYECSFLVPYGFGYPEYAVVSIYNIMDSSFNIAGYSAEDLSIALYPYVINTTQFTLDYNPWIDSVSPISSNGGKLVIYGRAFGFDESSSCNVTIFYKDKPSHVSVPTFRTPTSMIINDVKPTFKIFSIRIEKYKSSELLQSNLFSVAPFIKPPYPPQDESSSVSSSNSDISSSAEIPTPTPTQPPNPCISDCGGSSQGHCSSTGCICYSPWMGIDCKSKVIIIPTPSINNTIPSTNISIPSTSNNEEITYKGLISILELQELDRDNQLVFKYPFTQWIWSNISTDNESVKHLYSTNITNQLDQSITTVNVSIQYFDKQ
ncbi:hypothetical protein CYY_003832, partial [Polysphondylium violaceum]